MLTPNQAKLVREWEDRQLHELLYQPMGLSPEQIKFMEEDRDRNLWNLVYKDLVDARRALAISMAAGKPIVKTIGELRKEMGWK